MRRKIVKGGRVLTARELTFLLSAGRFYGGCERRWLKGKHFRLEDQFQIRVQGESLAQRANSSAEIGRQVWYPCAASQPSEVNFSRVS